MRFAPEFLDELRARLPVSEVVGRRVRLRKAGREWRGLSPFNKEKTPSFFVNDQKAMWFDFSSGKNGNIFDFVMLAHGVSFPDAVRMLAAEAGMIIPSLPAYSGLRIKYVKAPGDVARKEPEPEPDKAGIAAMLWSRSRPITGTPAETYLRSRQCFINSPALRYLAPRGKHSATMIARFGEGGDVTGIHLTKIKPDGSGKAGTKLDKLTLGPSMGQPIAVHYDDDGGDLFVTEGIEDAATLALVSGCSAWAAGAGGRIGPAVKAAGRFSRVIVAVDNDRAGRRALEDAREARADVVPLFIAKALGIKTKMDANKALIQFGADALRATIEWSLVQAAFARGQINFHGMQREVAHAEAVFRSILGDTL